MADFEDATAPTWDELIQGQVNLSDRWRGKLDYHRPSHRQALCARRQSRGADGPPARLAPRRAPRHRRRRAGRGRPVRFRPLSLAQRPGRARRRRGPYFYLPKLESLEEAALWSDVFAYAEERLGLERGTIKVTVLIETIPAAFEMDEILHALKDNIVGLNCGRWDYIFSAIKRLGRTPDRLTPDRSAMTMDKAFLAAYSLRLIATCHRRGAFAMGGMAALHPGQGRRSGERRRLSPRSAPTRSARSPTATTAPGSRIPALVAVAMEAFAAMPARTSSTRCPTTSRGRDEMLALHAARAPRPARARTSASASNISPPGSAGRGAVPLYNLMEDAATAEICRSQLWQWLKLRGAARRRPALHPRPVRPLVSTRKSLRSPTCPTSPRPRGWSARLVTDRRVRGIPDPPGLSPAQLGLRLDNQHFKSLVGRQLRLRISNWVGEIFRTPSPQKLTRFSHCPYPPPAGSRRSAWPNWRRW